MSSIFCCSDIRPYKNRNLSHEQKFDTFMSWGAFPRESNITGADISPQENTYVVQVVRQVNFGPLEAKRYFVKSSSGEWGEVSEKWLIDANFQKLNSYKNFKCTAHNKFFELNVYEKDPVNAHHWRSNIARPGTEIDL